jgi:hypothetical protein
MNCKSCLRPLTRYDDEHVSCKGGHVWRVSELPNENPPGRDLKPARFTDPVQGRVPAWVPGAVLGGLALAIELFQLLT